VFSLSASVLACLAFTVAPASALAAGPEAPETKPVTGETATTATAHGVLDPKVASVELVVEYEFFYAPRGAACTEAFLAPEAPGLATGKLGEAVEQGLTGLEPSTEYAVCLAARNPGEEGWTVGNSEPFKTLPAPPSIAEPPATGVAPTEARLEGLVNPNNQSTVCHVQYGTEASLTTSTTVACEPETLEGYGNQGSLVLPGLTQATPYYYRVVAKNASGEVESAAIEHFTTGTPEPPEASKVVPVTATEATLKGVLNPRHAGEAGSYEFVYEQSASECQGGGEKKAPEHAETAAGNEKEATKEVTVTGLEPGTTYTFCLLAKNTAEEPAISTPVTFTTLAVVPTITDEFTSGVEGTVATLHASIDPGGASTTYHFEYLTEEQFQANGETFTGATTTPESKPVGADNTEHPAEAALEGLAPSTTYHYRAVATNAQSPAGGTPGPDATFTTPAGSSTTPGTCPNAQARTEQPYGSTLPDCRAYEMVSPLDKNGGDVSFADGRAAASVSGEEPALTYLSHGSFSEPQGAPQTSRYLARREPGEDRWSTRNISPPRVLVQTETQVPYEEVLFTPSLSNGVVSEEYAPLVEDEPAGYINLYLADLASNPVSYQTISNVTPPVEPYGEGIGGSVAPKVAGASADLSHVVFQSSANLTPGATGEEQEKEHVYEWAAGKLSQIDVTPAGTSFEYADNVGSPGKGVVDQDAWHAVSANGLRVFFTGGEQGTEQNRLGQLYVRENPEQSPSRLNGKGECTEPAKACTVEVSASQRTDCADHNPCSGMLEPDPNGPQPAYYRDANAEGTRVFFTSRAELTNDAHTGEDNAANLYEYDLETKKLTDLTVDTNGDLDGAAMLGLVTASENVGEENSYVYFVANGVLASNENANKETAQLGSCREKGTEELAGEHTCSLYVDHYKGTEWEPPKFVATLVGGNYGSSEIIGDEGDWVGFEGGALATQNGPVHHTVRVTPDGAMLAFESERSLTGYDNEPVEPGAGASGSGDHCTERGGELKTTGNLDLAVPCREVYLYDAVTGKLVCASCDPSGARPVGPAELGGTEEDGTAANLAASSFYLPRNLSEDGDRLFFQTLDPLVPHDGNGKLDVYEWEATGEGTCRQPVGCIYPVSDVAGDYESYFMDASPSGDDVFIATADQLLPSDTDTRRDVYDVRVEGGFPVTASPPACDNGDSCKLPVSPQPGVFGPTGSATFNGIGNFPAAVGGRGPNPPKQTTKETVKCKKGFVKNKRGKCVRKPKSKKHKAKANRRAH